jgi:hypothetical protein
MKSHKYQHILFLSLVLVFFTWILLIESMIIFNLLESFEDVFERPVGVSGEVCPPIVVISIASIVERSIDDTTPTQCNGSGMPTFLVVERFAFMRYFANLISQELMYTFVS